MRLLALALLFAGCSTVPVPAPAAKRASVVAVRAWVESTMVQHQSSRYTEDVFLVRMADENGDPTAVKQVLVTNYSQGATHYLFNAAPGYYAVVACGFRAEGRNVRAYLSEKCIRESVFKVDRASLVFGGDFKAKVRWDTAHADAAQKHYFRVIDPKLFHASVLQRMIAKTGVAFERGYEIRRGPDALERFRKSSEMLLKDTAWPSHFQSATAPADETG